MTTRTYVLDTSVLLSDPWAVTRFAEHHVVLPLVVIGELEGKRHHHELGWFAREALRLLDDLRLEYGRLDMPFPIGDEGGTLQVNSITPIRPYCRPDSARRQTIHGFSRVHSTCGPRVRTSPWSPRTRRCG